MKWNDLTMSQRAEIIGMATKAGLRDINSIREFYNNSVSNTYQKGGGLKGGKNRGDKAGTKECAEWSNGLLRKNGYLISGNAWGLNHADMLFNGFDGLEKPSTYDRSKIEVYNHNAAGNVYNNFDSKTLDKSKPYVVNMYFNGSDRQEKAYNEGRGVTGTHTGILTHDGKQWNVTHNIHNEIHEEPFISLQSGNNQYGVTAIYEPRKDNIINRIKGFFGFGDGGNLDSNNDDNTTYNAGTLATTYITAPKQPAYYDKFDRQWYGIDTGGKRVLKPRGFNPYGARVVTDPKQFEQLRLDRAKTDDLNHFGSFAEKGKDLMIGLVTAPAYDIFGESINTGAKSLLNLVGKGVDKAARHISPSYDLYRTIGEVPISNTGISSNNINFYPNTSYPASKTSYAFFERPSKLTEAEKLGIPKGERYPYKKEVFEEAKKFSEKYGYDVPESIEDIKNMYRRHNTFFRTVNDLGEWGSTHEYPELLGLSKEQRIKLLASKGYPKYYRTWNPGDIGSGFADDFVFASPSLEANSSYQASGLANTVKLQRPISFNNPSQWHKTSDFTLKPNDGTFLTKGEVGIGNIGPEDEVKLATDYLIPVGIAKPTDVGSLYKVIEQNPVEMFFTENIGTHLNEFGGYLKPKYFAGEGILEDEDKGQSPITDAYMRTYNPSYNRPLKRVDSNWTDGLSGVGNLMQTIPHPLTQGVGTALTIPDLVVDLNNLEHSIRQGEGEQIYSDAMSVVRDYPLSLSSLTKGTKGIAKVLGKLDDVVPLFGYGEDVLNSVSDVFDYWDKWTYNKGKELIFGNKKENK